METINNTVGINGVNAFYDVQVIQKLLKQKGAPYLKVDGKCGANTKRAIIDFQRHFYKRPDGIVTPGKKTLEYLNTAQRPPNPNFKSNTPPNQDHSKPTDNSSSQPSSGVLPSICSNFQTRVGVPQDPKTMNVSENLTQLLKDYEGYSKYPYSDQDTHKKRIYEYNKNIGPTIGFGYLIQNEVEFEKYKNGISDEEAAILYAKKHKEFLLATRNALKINVTQNEFDAVFMISFNIGAARLSGSALIKIINGESTDNFEDSWMAYHFGKKNKNGKKGPIDGLGFRRQSELNIFCQNVYKRINRNSIKGGVAPFIPHFWKEDGSLE